MYCNEKNLFDWLLQQLLLQGKMQLFYFTVITLCEHYIRKGIKIQDASKKDFFFWPYCDHRTQGKNDSTLAAGCCLHLSLQRGVVLGKFKVWVVLWSSIIMILLCTEVLFWLIRKLWMWQAKYLWLMSEFVKLKTVFPRLKTMRFNKTTAARLYDIKLRGLRWAIESWL